MRDYKQFEVRATEGGDLWAGDGYVQSQRGGARVRVADDATEISGIEQRTFLGGSGRNVRLTSPDATGAPHGMFRAVSPMLFVGQLNGAWELRYDEEDGSVELHDGVDVVATAAAGTVPLGGRIMCGSLATAGGDGGGVYEVELGSDTGTVELVFNAFSVPDRFVVTWDGVDVIDTGLRGDDGDYTPVGGGAPETVVCDGVGAGTLSFNKAAATPTKATVTVLSPYEGTGWEFALGCPGGGSPPFPPSTLLDDGEFTLVATPYGETTYFGGEPFGLVARVEKAYVAATLFQKATVNPMAGTVPGQTFTAASRSEYLGDTDAAWTITVASDGVASISDGTITVAARASGLPDEAGGVYTATEDGAAAYNDGEPFDIVVSLLATPPRTGHVYTLITEGSPGEVTAAKGPFLARTMPAPSAPHYPLELAEILDGGTVLPIREGVIPWG